MAHLGGSTSHGVSNLGDKQRHPLEELHSNPIHHLARHFNALRTSPFIGPSPFYLHVDFVVFFSIFFMVLFLLTNFYLTFIFLSGFS
jgi:hypothetical protein